jgi:hypothetical protein
MTPALTPTNGGYMSNPKPRLTSLREQVTLAINKVDALFYNGNKPPIPEGATLESLWDEILKLKGIIKIPRKKAAIKLLLEDPELTAIPIPMIADIIKSVYIQHGKPCETSDNVIRWYISQMTLEWDIKQRTKGGSLIPEDEMPGYMESLEEEP